ncbi:hypothetical protein F4820DRAFT_326961 [Hypoxylon rubiginosum]|uniref:Uncharacterized protein n=1 Tax=Hypoxylon rubiginosum TaxID=110542 RepID=A0ACB9Z0A2_9PEZI|nr:hypothetical protein F4820DRAFT_326961 [Hypoxylon rubiginosum]
MEPPKNYESDELDDGEYTTSSSVASSPSPEEEHAVAEPLFGRFKELPPELRLQIWRAAIPTPGINFFNVHCIPNDHPGANRSTSPCWLYLDLRRLSVDDDDAAVSEYDPSAWQARANLVAVCREARAVCSVQDADAETITLTRPKRGLFVRAGDGQLRKLVPAHPAADDEEEGAPARPAPERLERRRVRVHRNEVLSLSVENCSFNLPYEEEPVEEGGGNVRSHRDDDADDDDADDDDDDDEDLGWTYDPQLMPGIPLGIPESRRCLNVARHPKQFPIHIVDLVSNNDENETDFVLCMSDGHPIEFDDFLFSLWEGCPVFWDRFDDCYLQLRWSINANSLMKVAPEKNDIRARYLRSSLLRSSKRPAQLF